MAIALSNPESSSSMTAQATATAMTGKAATTTTIPIATKPIPTATNKFPPVLLSHNKEPNNTLFEKAWTPHLSAWYKFSSSFLPKFWFGRISPENSMTYVTEWTTEENCQQVATKVSNDIHHWFEDAGTIKRPEHEIEALQTLRRDHLWYSMETFAEFCSAYLQTHRITGYKLKISNLRGQKSTQCPAFHVDNVPCRYTETLFGKGTVFLDPNWNDYSHEVYQRLIHNRPPPEIFGNNDLDDWKERYLEESRLFDLEVVQNQASVGRPALLIGHRWKELCSQQHKESRSVVLHRSPRNIPHDEGRILLVLDVVVREENEEGACPERCCH